MNLFSGLLSYIGVVGTLLVSVWAFFKYILLGSYRLSSDTSKRLIDKINAESTWRWQLVDEHVLDPKYPTVFETFVLLSGVFFYFSRNERLMTAGWQSKEDLSSISFFRWNRKKIDKLLHDDLGGFTVPINALMPSKPDKLGELSYKPDADVFLNEGSYEDMEAEIKLVLGGEKNKTGCLLYGPPGNGKTQFVKYIASKYGVPINVVYLNPDYDNYDIAKMFSEVPRRCIVLLEDFDNYFSARECSMKNDKVRFTFDSVINALDGVHNDYRGVVFMMTANDIEKIDDSIKNRPSRFKFVREFRNPNLDLRTRILGDRQLAEESEGLSLDAVFSRRSG